MDGKQILKNAVPFLLGAATGTALTAGLQKAVDNMDVSSGSGDSSTATEDLRIATLTAEVAAEKQLRITAQSEYEALVASNSTQPFAPIKPPGDDEVFKIMNLFTGLMHDVHYKVRPYDFNNASNSSSIVIFTDGILANMKVQIKDLVQKMPKAFNLSTPFKDPDHFISIGPLYGEVSVLTLSPAQGRPPEDYGYLTLTSGSKVQITIIEVSTKKLLVLTASIYNRASA